MADDFYAVLGVNRESTEKDIKKAFRQIARECHPDVVGDDPAKLARFKEAKEAYEVLSDETARMKYDRRLDRRGQRVRTGGSFRDAFYRRTADVGQGRGSRAHQRSARRVSDPANNIGLDDLFNDFGFGGSSRSKAGSRASSQGPSSRRTSSAGAPPRGSRERARPPMPQAGQDVQIDLDVPDHIARDGGTVTAVYYRMQRADNWRPGSPDSGIVRIQDIADVRLLGGTRHGEVLHEKGKGDAGAYGGPYGDLIVRVNLVRSRAEPQPEPPPRSAPEPESAPDPEPTPSGARRPRAEDPGTEIALVVDIDVWDAILGGPVEVHTPQGKVRVTVPAGTSSGKKLRLRGKGLRGPDGKPQDLLIRLRIVVPTELDAESLDLVEKLKALNATRG